MGVPGHPALPLGSYLYRLDFLTPSDEQLPAASRAVEFVFGGLDLPPTNALNAINGCLLHAASAAERALSGPAPLLLFTIEHGD